MESGPRQNTVKSLARLLCCVCSKGRHFPSTEGRNVPVKCLGAGESTHLTATAGKLHTSHNWDGEGENVPILNLILLHRPANVGHAIPVVLRPVEFSSSDQLVGLRQS